MCDLWRADCGDRLAVPVEDLDGIPRGLDIRDGIGDPVNFSDDLDETGWSGGGSPKSVSGRTWRSTPAVVSSETSPNELRSPSPRTKAETTKLTASMTPNVVRAKRTLLARRFFMVSLNMTVASFRVVGSVADSTHVVEDGIGGRLVELVGDLAVCQKDDAVGVAGGNWIVGNHHDRLTELTNGVAHEGQNLGAGRRVEVAGGFVGEDDLRATGQCPGHGDSLLLTAREFAWSVRESIRETHGGDDVVDPGPIGLGSCEVHWQRDVLDGSERRDEVERLEDEPQTISSKQREFTFAGRGHVCVADHRRSGVEAIEASHAVHER